MSPRRGQDDVREALIDEAARLLSEGGPTALTARKLAALIGTSTTAVYTYFGSMDELRRAVRLEAFTRMTRSLEAVPVTDDPVADAAALGAAYLGTALANPTLYRSMFLDVVFTEPERDMGLETFGRLSSAMERCISSGIVQRSDHESLALEFWAATHGVASLFVAAMWTENEALARMAGLGRTMLLGLGVSGDAADRALSYAADFIRPRPRNETAPAARRTAGSASA